MSPRTVRILHTNDLHGALDESRVALLKPARDNADLYFDSGDCIKTGNLGIPLKPEPVWPRLAELNCTASVPGNRESHLLRSALEAKIAGHQHPILCANLYDRGGVRIFPASLELGANGIRIGISGVMVPMVTDRMKTQSLSQMLWTPPIAEAVSVACELRKKCDLVIALTHIGFKQDVALAQTTDEIDLILGGHSHTVLSQSEKVGKTWICQGGSHGRYFGEYEWSPDRGMTDASLRSWVS